MPGDIGRPSLNIDGASDHQNALSQVPPRLSRSPHPYARRFPESSCAVPKADGEPDFNSSSPSSATQQPQSTDIEAKAFFDSDRRKRRRDSTTSSDSGTEADNESGPLLKSLPAPPARLRKGLKNATAIGIPSPLLTPSYLDDEKRRELFEASFKHRPSRQNYTSTHEETLGIRDKFRKRRRAELIRRMTETVLLLCIGGIACRKAMLQPIRKETTAAALVVGGTYSLYPLRLFNHHRRLISDARASRQFIRIPAAFDPATLLYPILLPVFVAASLLPPDGLCMTLNLVLGIASMPRAIIPFQDSFSGHTSVQWLMSVLPVVFLGNYTELAENFVPLGANPEVLVLLYPVHQALLPTLGYLTTTSLLPAELQLLSVSLINVLLSSSSPQALILQAVLWGGGLSLFVLCKRVLEWEVALARIPSWRLHRDGHDTGLRSGLRSLMSILPSRLTYAALGGASEDSDSDEPRRFKSRQSQTRLMGSSLGNANDCKPLLRTRTAMPRSPTQPDRQWTTNLAERRRERSSTLPSLGGPWTTNLVSHKKTKSQSMATFLAKPKTFLSLTKAQATVATWLYALYTYVVVIVVITGPIRRYLAQRAFYQQEPIGWALGYLLGDTATFRSLVVTLDLEQWIQLPNNDAVKEAVHGWAEEVRWRQLGAANTRLLICLHCICTIGLGLAVVFRLSGFADVDTRRKVFHGMMVVMFLPTVLVDPTFVALALTLVLALFLLLDLFRASQLPPLSRPLTNFLAPYVDGRDHRGPVIVSHIFLLIGCSIPLWLSLASLERSGMFPWQGWEVATRDLSMISGVVCVGMGDAAASLIGRRYGRRRWCWSGGKSLEGSAAFAAAVTLGLGIGRIWLLYGGWEGDSGDSWPLFFGKVVIAASGASLTEAVLTGGNDNVIVPVVLWLLVRGLGI
ncbi:MAG: hypothetical protein Q9186_003925 [Xanthomendoza sp. 1 TL-2023]